MIDYFLLKRSAARTYSLYYRASPVVHIDDVTFTFAVSS